MAGMTSTSHGVTATSLADGTTLESSAGKIQVKADGVTATKINVVGLDGATGKVNDINSTNFKSLSGSNLTGVGNLRFIETVDLSGGASATLDSSVLDLSAYKQVLVFIKAQHTTGTATLQLRFNDDSGANYNLIYVSFGADSHTSAEGENEFIIGALETNFSTSSFFVINGLGAEKTTIDGSGGGRGVGYGFHHEWTGTSALTKINLIASASTMTTATEMSIYGVV